MNAMVNTDMNRRSSCTYHPKGLLKESKALYKHTKIKAAHYIRQHLKLNYVHILNCEISSEEKARQKFKDSKRYAEELQLDCQFNEEATVISHADQVAVISTKESRSSKEILRKTTKGKRRTEVVE